MMKHYKLNISDNYELQGSRTLQFCQAVDGDSSMQQAIAAIGATAFYTALKEANEQLQKKYESEKKSCMRYYRQMTMLKQAITQLIGEQRITEEEVVKAVLTGQSVITLEDLLLTLSD
jgi:hypothetical protein